MIVRYLPIAGIMLALSPASAFAQGVLPNWLGSVQFTSFTAACNSLPASARGINPAYIASYRTKLDESHPNGGMTIVFGHGAVVVQSTSTAIPTPRSGRYRGTLANGNGNGIVYTGGTYSFNIRPATVEDDTQQITITGQITKYLNMPDCTAEFRGSFFRRQG